MPQMAPISWLILFLIFSFSFIIFNMLNFYCSTNKPLLNLCMNKPSYLTLIWKW